MLHARRSICSFALVALLIATALTRVFAPMPTYTDAFHHFNLATHIASGEGFIDHYLWNYLDPPAELPAPSHRYWMPLKSMIAALGMRVFGAPGNYAAAQSFFAALAAGSAVVAYCLTLQLGGELRQAWIAGLLAVFGGYFSLRWGAIDTFAPYACIGSLALLGVGKALSGGRHSRLTWILVGSLAGLGHLTRPDGLLLLLTAWLAIMLFGGGNGDRARESRRERILAILLVDLAYLAVMSPWFVRNIGALGTVLPTAGSQAFWHTDYNELFQFPAQASLETMLSRGVSQWLAVRWTAAVHNLATFVAVEGMIFLTPFMLIGLWLQRKRTLLRGFLIFALGIHLTMTLVFPLAGYRGGLFHAVAALLPFWMALGVLGLDITIKWIAARRVTWRAARAQVLFSTAALFFGVGLSLLVALPSRLSMSDQMPRLYAGLRDLLPQDARVMINDPAELYYYSGLGGVTLPNTSVHRVPIIASQYEIDYLVLEGIGADGFSVSAPLALQFDTDSPPDFLRPAPFDIGNDVRVYEIVKD